MGRTRANARRGPAPPRAGAPGAARCACAAAALLATAVLACAGPPRAGESAPPPHEASADPEARFLARVRQLTFAGRRSGEGYFSSDGRRIVFQSERQEDDPFYQIYLMDLESGAVERVSPGVGKTTCAWIHPRGDRVLFASTHLDPEARAKQDAEREARAAGEERRYAWDYDEHYDLFSVTLGEDAPPRRLTSALGYDAEGSWSPDGTRIVFASNREAYARPLSEEERARLERDPSYFVDVYVMDADGGGLRRLTETPGYDGGPFFSPDGERIVWRRFSEDGHRAEIFSMRSDGTDVRQLTRLGALSWAPFYHPSGDYVLFSTNLHGFDDFELYLVDAEGRRAPVRVTGTEGFDGLPSFSPDGERVAWTSTRTPGGRSQIFLARWNDGEARRALGLPPAAPGEAPPLPLPLQTSQAIAVEDLRAHVTALTDERTEGRLTGTRGADLATSYVARAFQSIGLAPGGDDGSYFQAFEFTAGVSLGDDNALSIESDDGERGLYVADEDWRPLAFSRVGTVPASEVVFAGYGLVAPEGRHHAAYDDYAGLEVEGRWVLVLRYAPASLSAEARRELHPYTSLRYKAMLARDRGARGILFASGPRSKVREELAPLRFDGALAGTSVAVLSITDALARALLAGSGRRLDALQDALDEGADVSGFVLPGRRVAAAIDLRRERRTGRNVVGRLVVGRAPSTSAVAVGAHVDHLGRGLGSSSLAREDEQGRIHPGADDDASGVAAMLEIAEQLAGRRQRGALRAERDLLFAAWSGEELGLLGSRHFVDSLGDPHAAGGALAERIVAYLNLDMVGRLEEHLTLYGLGSSRAWAGLIERYDAPIGLPVLALDESYLPTDATSFYLEGVPILSAFTGVHEDYHTPRDTAEKLDLEGARDVARLVGEIAAALAARSEPPPYVAMQRDSASSFRARVRVYLGTIPDYAYAESDGLRLAGVVEGGPAEEAGLRAGDIVVEVAGQRVENIYDYTYALDALAVGEPVKMVVHRNGERVELRVVPASRD
jgi:Tol biopolymer transport system component